MAVLPVSKAFRVVKGATFDYSFQYLLGTPGVATPEDLTDYTASWTLHTPGGLVTYQSGQPSGDSGVFFGGIATTPGNGIIDLVISATDTTAITWTTVPYNFAISSPLNVVTNLLTGSVTVVNTLP